VSPELDGYTFQAEMDNLIFRYLRCPECDWVSESFAAVWTYTDRSPAADHQYEVHYLVRHVHNAPTPLIEIVPK
jgi:hypothetical protein